MLLLKGVENVVSGIKEGTMLHRRWGGGGRFLNTTGVIYFILSSNCCLANKDQSL